MHIARLCRDQHVKLIVLMAVNASLAGRGLSLSQSQVCSSGQHAECVDGGLSTGAQRSGKRP
jgi:hypothetical protein